MGGEDGFVFGWREGAVLNIGTELVAPPEPARLSGTTLDVSANERPIPGTVPVDESCKNPILFGAPRTLDPVGVGWVSGRLGGEGRVRRRRV